MKIKAQLLVNRLTPLLEHALFTVKGLEWLRSPQLDAVDSYLPLLCTLPHCINDLPYATYQKNGCGTCLD
ncbi:MAG: hypothetical protein ABSA81_02915 [Candidatus Bathyarchaeia archaeon]